MTSQVVLITTGNDMFSDRQIVVECVHTLEFTRYVPAGKRLLNIFKLIDKDLSKLEKRYEMPPETIKSDLKNVNLIQLRKRFATGPSELLLIHSKDDIVLGHEQYEDFFNSMPTEELKDFVEKSRI